MKKVFLFLCISICMLMSGCGYKFTSIEDFHKISEVDSKYNRFDINFNGKQFKYKYEQRDCLNDERGYEDDYDKIQFGNSKLFKTQIKHNIITEDNLIKNEDKDVLLNDDKFYIRVQVVDYTSSLSKVKDNKSFISIKEKNNKKGFFKGEIDSQLFRNDNVLSYDVFRGVVSYNESLYIGYTSFIKTNENSFRIDYYSKGNLGQIKIQTLQFLNDFSFKNEIKESFRK